MLPAFTSEAELLRWHPEGGQWVALEGRVVLELLVQNDWDRMVVDTASPNAFSITRAEAATLLSP